MEASVVGVPQAEPPVSALVPAAAPTALRQSITIQKHTFSVPAPYAAGHAVDEAEAKALNTILAENIGNNFRKEVKKAQETHGESLSDETRNALQALLDAYSTGYSLSERKTRGPQVRDPVEAEARKIAKAKLDEAIKRQNVDKKALAPGVYERNLQALLDHPKHGPGIRELARQRVAVMKEIASGSLEDITAGA